ncbi:type II toxin-antitoxin system HicB family antitoxin [Desulfobacca acetoxidans]|uniref:Uncharacterized protein family UPF0150 n=1 Tax=Desulfobacca acetoxidans (strain ATCC 700848 / DSM 11109 / ASRB2) TaxID=880072 RepID=F2NFG3_DESAR|nr:2-oxoisovalerate dehydrogenase E1 subunit beta [Desulfobacca acetoxidans]AEB10082.1 Uncharacterized protein family UPF0150 [Desulfobacca acetoxidans DSM 11109]
MSAEIIFVVEEAAEGGYEAKALGHSIFTQGETLEEVREAVKDAVRCHFEDDQLPRIIRLHLVKDELLAV